MTPQEESKRAVALSRAWDLYEKLLKGTAISTKQMYFESAHINVPIPRKDIPKLGVMRMKVEPLSISSKGITREIDNIFSEIEEHLKEAGKSFADMLSKSEVGPEEIEKAKEQARKNQLMHLAKYLYKCVTSRKFYKSYNAMKDENSRRQRQLALMDEILFLVGEKRSALNAKPISEEEMNKAIEDGLKHGHLIDALRTFEGLVHWEMYNGKPNQIYSHLALKLIHRKINHHLEASGYDHAMLVKNEEPEQDHEEDRKKGLRLLFGKLSEHHIKGAKYCFERLSHPDAFNNISEVTLTEDSIRQHLELAGKNMSVLDDKEEKSSGQMENELINRVDLAIQYLEAHPQ